MVGEIRDAVLVLVLCAVIAPPAVVAQDTTKPSQSFPASLEGIPNIVEREIQAGRIPGAVGLIGGEGEVVYHRAFGDRALRPRDVPMTEDTIFDLASLTKVIATTTAVMQLVEQGKLRLEDPASRTYVIILTNRVYSGAKGDAQPLRKEISTVVDNALDSF